MATKASKTCLIHAPVGNNPARIRMLIYLKGLEGDIEMKTPADFGGMNSADYRALNPQGKIPTLLLPNGDALFESRVIAAYLADLYKDRGPSLMASTPEGRARADLINSIHDLYIASPNSSDPSVTANQGCGYKGVELIDGTSRASKLLEVARQVTVLEGLFVGPFAAGEDMTLADLALFPTIGVLVPFCFRHSFGWCHLLDSTVHPKLCAWMKVMDALPVAKRVRGEMEDALKGWVDSGRFVPIREQVQSCPECAWEREAVMAKL